MATGPLCRVLRPRQPDDRRCHTRRCQSASAPNRRRAKHRTAAATGDRVDVERQEAEQQLASGQGD